MKWGETASVLKGAHPAVTIDGAPVVVHRGYSSLCVPSRASPQEPNLIKNEF